MNVLSDDRIFRIGTAIAGLSLQLGLRRPVRTSLVLVLVGSEGRPCAIFVVVRFLVMSVL